MMRCHPMHRKACEIVQSGCIGKPTYARAQLSCWYPPLQNAWRQDPQQGGGGALPDLVPHCVDILETILGQKVASVMAIVKTLVHNYPVDDTAVLTLQFDGGTDIYVQPEKQAAEGFAACLDHIQHLKDPVELVLMGGDSIMESFDADDARTKEQWTVWNAVLNGHCSLPVRSAIGNHDIWGCGKTKSKTTGSEPNYGKRRALAMLRLDNRYYTFSEAGWQFIVLDSVQIICQQQMKSRSWFTVGFLILDRTFETSFDLSVFKWPIKKGLPKQFKLN
jgi:hypothetical protein